MTEVDKAQELYSKKKASKVAKQDLEPFCMWSFILAIAPFFSFFFLFIPIANILFALVVIPAPVIAIILGIVGLGKVNNKKYFGKGYAIAGIIIGTLQILIAILGILFFLVSF